jgi:hypothetical protein
MTCKTFGTDKEGNSVVIDITTKRGYFSITGTVYEKGKRRTEKNMIVCECIHRQIIECRPDLKRLVDLHLSDLEGIPMHAIANGFYFLTNGFKDSKDKKKAFCDYYRMNDKSYYAVCDAKTKDEYAAGLVSIGMYEAWRKQAIEGLQLIKELKELKG